MKIPPEHLALLDEIRNWAQDPLAVFFNVRGKQGSVAIFPADIIDKTDEQLFAFIVTRCRE